jgi:hypothetical protein
MNEEKLNLLIVEDKESQLTLYRDHIDLFNSKSSDLKIIPSIAKSLAESLEKINTESFDAAIIDLKLRGDSFEIEGEAVIKEIRKMLRFPIYVVSNVPKSLSPELQESSTFYNVYNSTEKDTGELLIEIVKLYNTGITRILGKRGLIEDRLQEIFWKHITPLVDTLDANVDTNKHEKILLRHITNYLYEYLQLDEEDNFENYHVEEFYIIPCIRSKCHTGDIISCDGKNYVILSPACDMACGKAKPVSIAEIEELNMPYFQQQIDIIKKELPAEEEISVKIKAGQAKAEGILDDLLKNKNSLKYHFLPRCSQFEGGFINFQKVKSVSLKELQESFKSTGRISETFLREVINRFSHYYSRQGQPNFNFQEIREKLLD